MESPASSVSPRRATLLARLAAERAALLSQLEGLDEAALTHDPVIPGWTAAMLLAHIAYWDAFTAGRLGKLADGRRDEIATIDNDFRDARNADMQARFAGLPFAEGLALCLKERRGLLLALGRLDDAALERRVRLRPGWRVAASKWVRWRWRHDTEHSADLIRWRAGYPPNDPEVRVIHRTLLRPIMGLSRGELLALAAIIPPDERETQPIEGDWTLKQVLGHMSDYERPGVLALRQVAAGREPAYERTIEAFEAFNEERGAVWAATPWPEVWAQFVAVRRALLEVAATLDDAALARPFTSPWLTTTTACGYLLDMAGHEQEHADAIRPALSLPALPWRLRRNRL